MEIINLPPPQTDFDFPLMKALALRRTKRKWLEKPLSEQEISNLLWAACGITQPETKRAKSKRTVPSACNSQEINVYVVLENGLFLYNETLHQLEKIHSDDMRQDIGTQKMMRSAPLGLVYVADFSKMKSLLFKSDQDKLITASADTGFISQNVYLYCAAAGLSTAVLGLVNRQKLHKTMKLNNNQRVMYSQVVGLLS
ncbi:MAG: SagB/ThcOx family dehydrogenase [Prolixibacteraceae bacterium]|nr:SagB/ThcOx family dehydrogenase [Prolixibacteraceae bacterium]MBN2650080.1 SagB/ThcOx family dehydrogenase [Prolixibacteraceae bacterium]